MAYRIGKDNGFITQWWLDFQWFKIEGRFMSVYNKDKIVLSINNL